MVFSSLVFLCIFLPVVFVLHTIIPSIKVKNALLIIASLFFYAYGEPVYVLLMIFSSILNFLCAKWVATDSVKVNKIVMAVAIVINLAMLGVFKYTDMILSTVNSVFSTNIPLPHIVLPIGISFFTFQALSYVVDVYRGVVGVQKNYFNVLLYISFFPQLIAGPIVKYRDVNDQIDQRTISLDNCAKGLRRFIWGLSKKIFIANTMASAADAIFAQSPDELHILTAWLGALAYLFQIYYDFSAYSDMAIGLGHMFGFDFKENFDFPYSSTSVQEFWRRWHISLSTWFKEYLYIPLGGNRKGKFRTALNKLIVFFCTGLWHGANWTFVVWGLFHGFFLLLETYIPKIKKLPKFIGHIYTMLIVTIAFVMFRADTLSYSIKYIGNMFAGFGDKTASLSLALTQLTPWFIVMFVIAVIGCAPIKSLAIKVKENLWCAEKTKGWLIADILLYVVAFVALLWCVIRLSSGAYNPFIYFRF